MRIELYRSMNSRFPEYLCRSRACEQHRLGHGQPETLGAMEGDVTVTCLNQAVQLATVKGLIENDHPSLTRSRTKPRGLFGMAPQVSWP